MNGATKKAAVMIGGLLLSATAAVCASPVMDFENYRVIIDRKPFGNPPAAEVVPVTISPSESFARSIRLCGLVEVDGGGIKVGLIDTASNKNFFLGVGDTEEGIELVSADYEAEEAVLRKGPEMAVIKLQSGVIQPLTPAEQQARMNAPTGQPGSRRMSYAERRLARQQQRQQEPPPQPKYTGEELEQHLKDYQMEVIRQGLPPLPIPLTPEMDQQLVNEGVLPPAE